MAMELQVLSDFSSRRTIGCISSKVITRSLSFQEELSQSMHKRGNGIPKLEELFISNNGSEQLLPLVCTINTLTNKSQSVSSIPESNPDPVPVNTEAANPWELMASLQDRGEGEESSQLVVPPPKVVESGDSRTTRRSKSCHWSSSELDVFVSYALQISNGIKEVGYSLSNKGILRCRSFHTVDEYDAMVERIWMSRSQETDFDDDDVVTRVLLHPSGTSFQESQQIQTLDKTCLMNKHSAKDTEEAILSPSSCNTVEDVARNNNYGKEPKRKAIAKELKSLRIPSTIEFPAIANLREWLPAGGQIYSPEAYVTPKFGSYALPIARIQNESRTRLPFSPVLVAAFEESMQQLVAEEDNILKQMARRLEEDRTSEKESKGGKKMDMAVQ